MSDPNADTQPPATVTGEDAKKILASVEMKKFLEENPNATEQEQRAHADEFTASLKNQKDADLIKKALQAIDDRTRTDGAGSKETTSKDSFTKESSTNVSDVSTSGQTITNEQAIEVRVHDAMKEKFGHPPTTEQEAATQKAYADKLKEGFQSQSNDANAQAAHQIIDEHGKDNNSKTSAHEGVRNSRISGGDHVEPGTNLQPKAIASQGSPTAHIR